MTSFPSIVCHKRGASNARGSLSSDMLDTTKRLLEEPDGDAANLRQSKDPMVCEPKLVPMGEEIHHNAKASREKCPIGGVYADNSPKACQC